MRGAGRAGADGYERRAPQGMHANARCAEEEAEHIAALGMLPVLLEATKRHMTVPATAEMCCTALHDLSSTGAAEPSRRAPHSLQRLTAPRVRAASTQLCLVQAGAVPVLLAVLRKNTTNGGVVAAAFSALANCSASGAPSRLRPLLARH